MVIKRRAPEAALQPKVEILCSPEHPPVNVPYIKATCADDLRAGKFWLFMVDGKPVYPPSWFLDLIKL